MATIKEEKLSYNGNAFTRLLTYVRPYWRTMVLCTALVLAVTALNLYRPILIGDAIDRYIEGYDHPYAYVEQEKAQVTFQGRYLSTEYDEEKADAFAVIVYREDRYYLIQDLDRRQTRELLEKTETELTDATVSGGTITVPLGNVSVSGTELSRQQLSDLRQADRQGIQRIALIYAVVLVLTVICELAEVWLLQRTGQNIIFDIRQQVFEHIHTLPLRFFDTNPVGRIVTRVTNDVESLNRMYTQVLVKLFSNTVLIVGYAVVMLRINARLAALCFLFLPVIFALTVWFRSMTRKVYRIVRTKISALNTFLSENISGMKLIQIFVREREKAAEFKERTDDLYRSQMRELLVFSLFRPGIAFVANFALATVVYRSGVSVLAGALTLGTMYVFTNYIRSFFRPIEELAEQFSSLQNALASAEKIFTVLDERNTIPEPTDPVVPEKLVGHIEFRNVWFAYEGDDYVLRDVSFEIHPGEKVAFVGATGAGKSSILNLIGRYYDIQKGQILVDGVDIRRIPTAVLRRAIGQVQQDVFVFTGDIRSNIRLLDEEMSEEKVRRAAEAANADQFIRNLPGGYDEPVTERGATLSAGQRQLLSFARTLAYDPAILVMDEATANIDTETERLIQGALETLMEGRTTIMVAHRLSTIQHADNIIVMHKGRIRESGTHQQLLARNGIYRKLYELQQ
jgi:ATP-binding cassette subfamily B protein